MTEQSEHLSNAQIENYGNRTSGAGPEAAQRDEHLRANHQSSDDQSLFDQRIDQQVTDQRVLDQSLSDERVEAHLADCASCRNRLLDFHRHRFALFSGPAPDAKPTDSALADSKFANSKYPVQTQVRTAATPECPSDDALRQLAAGLTPEDAAPALTRHAATCDYCGPLLRTYTEIFSDDFTAEEQAALDQLRSVSPKWQQQTAREMLKQARKNPGPVPSSDWRSFFSWKWATALALATVFAIVALGGVAGFLYSRRDTPKKAERYLAQAYTQKRPMEMRWPGAAWARPHITLGPSESVLSKPGPLIDAEKLIKDHETTSDDSKWLQARAEVEILEGNPQNAIDLLSPATLAHPDSGPLLMDLALAYSQKPKGSQYPKDSLTVIDLLSRVLKKEPENRTALFNLAIAYGYSQMWDQAVATWEHYLQLDPTGPWADEAGERLEEARTRLRHSVQYPSFPSNDVTSFLILKDAEISFRSEQYQEIALRDWLVKAVINRQNPERDAVTRLAQVFARFSSDIWWHDFVRGIAHQDASGAEALSAAFMANVKGHYSDAVRHSFQAAKIFREQQNVAGELRARYELVYAQRRLLQMKNCQTRADLLQSQLAVTQYSWLQAQVAMELAICLNFISQPAESEAALSHSMQIASTSNLPICILRTIGFAQGLHSKQHHFEKALREGSAGLQAYWAGPPSTERIYQFYAGFSVAAQGLDLPAAAEVLMRHAVDILRTEDDKIQLGAALEELSKLLAVQKDNLGAEAAAAEANQLYESERDEPTSRLYRLVAKIGLAELQLRRGKPEEARATLQPATALLSETDGNFVSLDFYRVSGNIDFALGRLNLAASAYETAIIRAERALSELKTDRQRLEWIGTTDDAYRGLVRVFLNQRNPEDAWKLWEWYASRSYSENLVRLADSETGVLSGWPDLWSRISSISRATNGPARLVYAVFSDGVQIWVIQQNKLQSTWVPIGQADLEQRVRQFSQACARKSSSLDDVQTQGRDLFMLLVQPVAESLERTPLISVELDRILSDLPLEAVRSPQGWYFAEKHPVVYSPGIMLEQWLRPRVNLSSHAGFLLADVSGSSYLPGHDLELSTISRTFSKLTIVGVDSNLENISVPLSQSTIFGFIGHGEPNETGAGLRINPNLLLKAQDFRARDLRHLQLAVLSACSTAASGSEGLLNNRSLVHAFLTGGVPDVVASRWNVDSKATADLISDFYIGVAHNESAPDALFSARNRLLKTYSHPYYWAGFSVTGKQIN